MTDEQPTSNARTGTSELTTLLDAPTTTSLETLTDNNPKYGSLSNDALSETASGLNTGSKSLDDSESPNNVDPQSKCHSKIVKFSDLPSWRQDNKYVVSGYWHISQSYTECLKSLVYLHNETGNVYTHLLGAIAFFTLLFISFGLCIPVFETTTAWDILVMIVFLSGAVVCLMLSTLFHLFQSHSREVCFAWNKADYAGIVILIVSSFVPAIYYGFLCDRIAQIVYISFIIAFGILTMGITISKTFSAPKWRPLRVSMFLGMGLSAVLPLAHATGVYGFEFMTYAMAANYLILMGSLYVAGALIYAFRVPEKWWPGKFDIFFHSHQIFHVLVVAAAVTHYIAVMRAYKFWHRSELNLCPTDLLNSFHELKRSTKFGDINL